MDRHGSRGGSRGGSREGGRRGRGKGGDSPSPGREEAPRPSARKGRISSRFDQGGQPPPPPQAAVAGTAGSNVGALLKQGNGRGKDDGGQKYGWGGAEAREEVRERQKEREGERVPRPGDGSGWMWAGREEALALLCRGRAFGSRPGCWWWRFLSH